MAFDNKENKEELDTVKQLQRALYYESQFRNAIVSDAISFYDANITQDIIESDFFLKDDEGDFISVPDYLDIQTPCKFTEFIDAWAAMMIPDMSQKTLKDLSIIRNKLIDTYNKGGREYVFNYWAESINGKRSYYNHRFLLTRNEFGDICALSIVKDLTNLKEWDDEYMHSELEQYAYSDPITNGYNYIKFKEILRFTPREGSIISLDIHSFKMINSICGVTKGDEVIKFIWQCILEVLDFENGELAAHINADHYIIFMPTTDEDAILKKIKVITLELTEISVDMDVPQIQPYFGVSKWIPGKKIELSYNEAVTAKHNAKFQQEINWAFFNEEDTLRLIREKELIDGFEEAILKKEFEIWFQPKYTPKTRQLVGAEALVRWKREDGTMMRPDEFIPLFERNNMIRTLDEYIFKSVCQYQKRWQTEGKKIVPVSVNLSRASLYFKGLSEQYKRITEVIKIDSKYMPIEITETAAITNEKIKEIAESFHNAGFSLQIDDFGSGYSTLSTINMMHFDTLKLDKSLIDFIGNYGGNRLIEHTISLAKELGIKITAEGVETEAQVKFLKHIGCDNIQGFFYSKPVRFDVFEEYMDKGYADAAENKIDLVEDHLYAFNQGYYKPAMYSLVINMTKDLPTDYTENEDWTQETEVENQGYQKSVDEFVKKLVHSDYKEAVANFLSRARIIEDFDKNGKVEETRIIEYNRDFHGDIKRMRIVLNIFKVEDSTDVWAYLKVFRLD